MEKTQIATIETKVSAEPIVVTAEDIKNLFCPLANTKEVALGLGVVKSLGLNPFLREVHFIKYSQNDKMAIVVGYEVYIKRAERSGKLNGWKAGIDSEKGVAWVEIHRKDWTDSFYWEVTLSEFDKKQSTWKQIPSFMAKKVAIAQGFRLCFPEDLGNMPYTPEEQQAFDIEVEPVKSSKPVVEMPKEVENKDVESIKEGTVEIVNDEIPSEKLEPESAPEISADLSKNNLKLVRDVMAKCKDLEELKKAWSTEMTGYREKYLPSDYEKAVKAKDYFKNILQNREKAEAKNGK